MRSWTFWVFATVIACGGSSERVKPDTGDFTLPPDVQEEIDGASERGQGAEGSYEYSESDKKLTLSFQTSTFGCNIEAGTPLVATVTELSATAMEWQFADDGGTASWLRLSEGGEGIVGVWKSESPTYYLILDAEGGAQIFSEDVVCNDDRRRNGESCYEVRPSSIAVQLDESSAEWDATDALARLADEQGDQIGDDLGADIVGLRTAVFQSSLYVFTEFAGTPSPEFVGEYRFTVWDGNGFMYQDSAFYDLETQGWKLRSGESSVSLSANERGFEWKVDMSLDTGASLIMIQSMDFNSSEGVIDESNCGFFDP